MDFFMTGSGNSGWPENHVISEDEVKIILTGLFESNESFTEDEAMKIIRWAEHCRIDSMLLDLVLERQLNVFLKNGEITFFRNKENDYWEDDEGEEGDEF